jgi:tRNA pseudouridine32 synthase/23S rRNA pseudouridine746 synthase
VKSPHIYEPPQGPLSILHADASIFIVDKPAGLLSVPGTSSPDSLETRLKAEHPEALLIHRLDMDTSGVMVFARTKAAQRALNLQFETRQIGKTYIADVEGAVAGEAGTIDLPLIVDWPNRPLQIVCQDTGKPAQTDWRVTQRLPANRTRLALTPLTGRTHQLRVHMAAIGHPIIGDRFYGNAALSLRMHLHAQALTITHPKTGARQTYAVDVPF